MIAVDSSVWIDHFSGRRSAQVDALDRLLATRGLPILEVPCGFRSARQTAAVRRWFEPMVLGSMLDFDLVPAAVANYQTLSRRGITPGAVDMIVATYCIETGAELLTADRDF